MLSIKVDGAKQFRAALKRADFDRELSPAHKRISQMMQERVRPQIPRAHARSAVRASGTKTAAKLRISPGRRGDALALVLGQKQRSGWYGHPRYRRSSGRQFRPWLGSGWDYSDLYFIGPTILRSFDDAEDIYLDEMERIARRAFPD